MTSDKIREIAIDSIKSYNQFLEDHNKGIQEVETIDIEQLNSKDLILKLRLAAKLFDH